MRTVFTLLGTLLLSLAVALAAAQQLGFFFNANAEFTLVLMAVSIFTLIAMVALTVVYAVAKQECTFHVVALALGLLAGAPVALPGLVQKIADRSTNPFTVGIENTYITLELIIPALLAVVVQWGLVRWRWLRVRGADGLTRWPWVTTIVAALVILNPIGLAFIGGALNQSSSNWLRDMFLMVALAGVLILVVMGGIECYIRGRVLRRRQSAAAQTEI